MKGCNGSYFGLDNDEMQCIGFSYKISLTIVHLSSFPILLKGYTRKQVPFGSGQFSLKRPAWLNIARQIKFVETPNGSFLEGGPCV